MPISIVVGGQFGSEGKGKTSYLWAKDNNINYAVRVGGINSGHTVINDKGETCILRILPTASLLPNRISIIPSGSYIDINILFDEMARFNISNVIIDPYCMIISDEDIFYEENNHMKDKIGSTQSGTGRAVIRRIERTKPVLFAKDIPALQNYIVDTKSYLRELLNNNERIIIEGTQGYGLSILHSNHYPYVTSRDTSAAGVLMETGLSPIDVDEIVLVLRAFPIRVSGNSGFLPNEIYWKTLTAESNAPIPLSESTTVTKKIRRVGRFDADIVNKAISVNHPTKIVLNHVDYFDYSVHGLEKINDTIMKNIELIEEQIHQKIDFVGTSESIIIKL